MTSIEATPCYTCEQSARVDGEIRENVWTKPGWRVAHSFNSGLAGWLVVVPTRHVEAMDELSDAESDVLGRLLRDVSRALKVVTGCVKTYVILLAEAPGFNHLHFHVIPRLEDLPEDRRGTKIFGYAKDEPLSAQQQDDVARALREALENP